VTGSLEPQHPTELPFRLREPAPIQSPAQPASRPSSQSSLLTQTRLSACSGHATKKGTRTAEVPFVSIVRTDPLGHGAHFRLSTFRKDHGEATVKDHNSRNRERRNRSSSDRDPFCEHTTPRTCLLNGSQSGVALRLPPHSKTPPGSRLSAAILDCAGRAPASTALSLGSTTQSSAGWLAILRTSRGQVRLLLASVRRWDVGLSRRLAGC
jgi:hypothetical protein